MLGLCNTTNSMILEQQSLYNEMRRKNFIDTYEIQEKLKKTFSELEELKKQKETRNMSDFNIAKKLDIHMLEGKVAAYIEANPDANPYLIMSKRTLDDIAIIYEVPYCQDASKEFDSSKGITGKYQEIKILRDDDLAYGQIRIR